MAFSWELDTEKPPVILGDNLTQITIEELEDGVSQSPRVTYSGSINMDKGDDITQFKSAIKKVFNAKKEEIITARDKRARLAEIVGSIEDGDFSDFETGLNQ